MAQIDTLAIRGLTAVRASEPITDLNLFDIAVMVRRGLSMHPWVPMLPAEPDW